MARRRNRPSLARLVEQLLGWAARGRRARPSRPAQSRAHRDIERILREQRLQREREHRSKLRQKRLQAASTAKMVREAFAERDRIARRYQRAGFTLREARQQADRDLVERDEQEAADNELAWWYA